MNFDHPDNSDRGESYFEEVVANLMKELDTEPIDISKILAPDQDEIEDFGIF